MKQLIEREIEVAEIERLLCRRNGGIQFIQGAVGAGKTSLIDEACRKAHGRGFKVLRANGSRIDRDLPFVVLSQLAQNFNWTPDEPPVESRTFNEYMLSVMRSRLSEVDQGMRWDIIRVWCSLIANIGRRGPVLIAVDDIHHADAHSLETVLHLLRRSFGVSAYLVFGLCSGARQADPVSLSELRRHPDCRTLRLSPLTPAAVASLLTAELGVDAGARRADHIHEQTGGNPLLVTMLAEDNLTTARTSSADLGLTAGESFEQAVFSSIQRIDPLAPRLAKAVAVLGESVRPALLGDLLGVSGERASAVIHALEDAGILTRRMTFRHPAARSAALRDTHTESAARLHYQAAALAYARNAPVLETARHLLNAGPRAEPWVWPALEDAAQEAIGAGDIDLAVECLELALRCATNDKDRATASAALASAAWQRSPRSVIKYLRPLVTEPQPQEMRGKHTIEAVYYLLDQGHFDDAADLLRGLRQNLPELVPVVRSELDTLAHVLRTTYPGVLDHLGEQGQDATQASQHNLGLAILDARLHASKLLATVLANEANESTAARAEQLIRRSLSTDAVSETAVIAASRALLMLVYAERIDAARNCHNHLMSTSVVQASPAWRAQLSVVGAEIALREGGLGAAEEWARSALNHVPVTDWGLGAGAALGVLTEAATAYGNHEEAGRLLRLPVHPNVFRTRYGLHYLLARGRHHLATGANHAALDDFLYCGQLMTKWGMDLPALVPWRSSAARAWARLGKREEARASIEDELALIRDSGSRSRGIALSGLAEISDLAERRDLLSEAVDMFANCGDRLRYATSLADLARCTKELGNHSRAEMMFRRSTDAFIKCGIAEPPTGRSPGDSAQQGLPAHQEAPVDSLNPLSGAEFRVATLAASGFTNREIAAKLFITASTVEQHLTRVYRKLAVRNRRALEEALRDMVRPGQLFPEPYTPARRIRSLPANPPMGDSFVG